MRLSLSSLISAFLLLTAPLLAAAEDTRMLTSKSLNPCMKDSKFSATLFDVEFYANNGSLVFDVNGVADITGNITIEVYVIAYGLNLYHMTIDPCEAGSTLKGMCPMREGPLNVDSNADIPKDALKDVPGITYTIPDLDAKVQVYFNSTDTGEPLACVEAELSNGKTVDQKAVAWALAVISGLALVASAVVSGLGHSNASAHVAANAMSLFSYFQAQALIGMTTVDLPPIVSSWTQNFQWSMGIIRIGFVQDIATWYQRSTGGQASQILSNLGTASVQVQKRSAEVADTLMRRAATTIHEQIIKRTNSGQGTSDTSNNIVVKGIERVGFRARIEPTNIFMTGYIFFLIFVIFVVLGVVIFKLVCEALTKAGRMKGDKFSDFRNGWTTVLRGIMFRVVLVGFVQMVVLCLWELTRNDSGAIMALAVFTFFTVIGILGWASSKVIRLARRSIAMHKNPAYILYSDPVSLNKWGFLYVQFKATAYFFVVPVLVYLLIKGAFIGLAQGSGVTQAVALVVIEAVFLVGVCIMTPYMDKKTNAFNISIQVINFISSIFLLVFSDVFDQPGIVTGAMGVVFFVYNAVFSTVLLLIVLITSIIAIVSKNPDTRYQPMRDDRGSFIKSQSQLTTELDALGATARGESKHGLGGPGKARIEDDDDSWSGGSTNQMKQAQHNTAYQGYSDAQPPRSPGFPSDAASGRHMPPGYQNRGSTASPYDSRAGSMTNNSFRPQGASPSPWQRGAGYD